MRIVQVRHNGETYTPVVTPTGQVLDRAQLEALSVAQHMVGRVRRLRFTLIDECVLPGGGHLDFENWTRFEAPTWLPLMFADLDLPIGIVEGISPVAAGTIPGVVGRSLIATARLHETRLAALAWDAVQNATWSGVCLEFTTDPRDGVGITLDGFAKVHLGDVESNCCPGAIVRAAWEEPRPADGPCASRNERA